METKYTFILEFVRQNHIKGLYIQVHVVHEGEGSHPNKRHMVLFGMYFMALIVFIRRHILNTIISFYY